MPSDKKRTTTTENGPSSKFASVFKSITKSFKGAATTSTSTPVVVPINPIVVGGATDQLQLYEILRSNLPINQRAAAAASLSQSIEKFSLSSVPELWYAARDMIHPTVAPSIRRTCLKLLNVCIKYDDLASDSSQMAYYDDIVTNINQNDIELDFDWFLIVLKSLTKDGRHINVFCISDIAPFAEVLNNWLELINIQEDQISTIKQNRRQQHYEPCLENMIKYVSNCLKLNFGAFNDAEISNLLSTILDIAKSTTEKTILLACIKTINITLVYGSLPIELLYATLEIVCGASTIDDELQKTCWDLTMLLAKGNISSLTIATILGIISSDRQQNGQSVKSASTIPPNTNAIIGAIKFIQEIFSSQASDGNRIHIDIHLSAVLTAFIQTLDNESEKIDYQIISTLYYLLTNEATLKFFKFEHWYIKAYSPLVMFEICARNCPKPDRVSTLSPRISSIDDSLRQPASELTSSFVAIYNNIFSLLRKLYIKNAFPGINKKLMEFYCQMADFIDDETSLLIITYYEEQNLCIPFCPEWKDNCSTLLWNFYLDDSRSTEVRLKVLDTLKNAYDLSKGICDENDVELLISHLFCEATREKDKLVFGKVLEYFVQISVETSSKVFKELIAFFNSILISEHPQQPPKRRSIVSLGSLSGGLKPMSSKTEYPQSTITTDLGINHYERADDVVKKLCRIFVLTMHTDGDKAKFLYDSLITVCETAISTNKSVIFVDCARLFTRLFVTTDGAFYLNEFMDMEGVSAAVGRNLKVDSEFAIKNPEATWWYPQEIEFIKPEDFGKTSKELFLVSNNKNSDLSEKESLSETSNGNDLFKKDFKFATPAQSPRYSSTDSPSRSSNFVQSNQQIPQRSEIEISKWLGIIIRIIENGANWEIYSFIWAHLCPQLLNVGLFKNCTAQILRLRQLMCDQLTIKLPNVELPKDISKGDIHVAIVRTMSPLIAYHSLFTKKDEDAIVKSIIFALTSWEKTAIPCIHCLNVCCYEFPLSIKKFIAPLFTQFQTRISSPYTSAHILELLLALVYIPSLTANFTFDEFKRVFGMSFKFIQYAHDMQMSQLSNPNSTPASSNSKVFPSCSDTTEAEYIPSTLNLKYVPPAMSQYLLTLSYDLISSWFLQMRQDERKQIAPYLIRNLTKLSNNVIDETGKIIDISEQNMVFIDLLSRFSYSDLDLRSTSGLDITTKFGKDRPVVTKQWIYGTSVVTIATDTSSGDSVIVIRRPTGIAVFELKPDPLMIPSWVQEIIRPTSAVNEVTNMLSSAPVFTPNYMMLQLMFPTDPTNNFKPIPLPDDAATSRAVSTIDRTPIVGFHKVGIIYIGPGQVKETEILRNTTGSRAYRKFLSRLGRLVKLSNNKNIYSGGLDTENDIDGEFAYFWDNKITQLIFHTVTMMPNPKGDYDPGFAMKKRHIGNNYVNIYFNESGLAFDFNTIKSQFNFINIIIYPHTRASGSLGTFLDQENNSSSEDLLQKSYVVKVLRRAGSNIPAIFAATHFKIVSEENLSMFVRNIALVASIFSNVWHTNGEYTSNWKHRMIQIKTLKDRAVQNNLNHSTVNSASGNNHNNIHSSLFPRNSQNNTQSEDTTKSFLDQLTGSNSDLSSNSVGRSSSKHDNRNNHDSNNYFYDDDSNDDSVIKNIEFVSFT